MPFWNVVLAALTAFGLQGRPAPDAALAPRQGAGTIKGRVVDAATKAPVAGARVRLTGTSQREPVPTDAGGAFVFSGLPAGNYSFVIEKNGYLSTSWPVSSRWVRRPATGISLAAAATLEDVTVVIDRGSVVAGRVTTGDGDPLAGGQVSLVSVMPPTFSLASTNDLGDYRIANVPTGRYLLHAQPPRLANDPQDRPMPGPQPTYYPRALSRREAQEIVVGPAGEVTQADLRLLDGPLSLLDVTATYTDGRPVTSGTIGLSSMTDPLQRGHERSLRTGVARFELPPGEYTLYATAPSGLKNETDRVTYDAIGMTRLRVPPGVRESATVVVGRNATASGRIVFEGESAPPPIPTSGSIPALGSAGQICRFGEWTVAPDWSFTIQGLAGTCHADRPPSLMTRWAVKSVTIDGRNVLDDDVWFEPGRHYQDVRIVMTDRRAQLRVRVTEPNGTPTGEYAGVLFPVQPDRWRSPDRYVSAAAPLPASFVGMADPSGTGGVPGLTLRFIGLQSGEYYVIAVDDIEHTAMRDPAVLAKLARVAARVTIPPAGLIEVPLQRFLLSDVVK